MWVANAVAIGVLGWPWGLEVCHWGPGVARVGYAYDTWVKDPSSFTHSLANRCSICTQTAALKEQSVRV